MLTRSLSLLALAGGLIAVSARAPIPVLRVVASDFAYSAPDSVAAGLTRVRMTGAGHEPHILQLVRLAVGHDAAEFLAHFAEHHVSPRWATFVGGPTVVVGRDSTELLLDLEPGQYLMFCPVTTKHDHEMHAAKGMLRTLTVLPNDARGMRRAPEPDLTITLDDYGFLVKPAPAPGRRTILVQNRAAQPHEVVIVRLQPGKRVMDVVEWAKEAKGPPPGSVVGGTTALSRGQVAHLEIALLPGTYAMLCYVPDAKDGRSHVAHGMIGEFTVE